MQSKNNVYKQTRKPLTVETCSSWHEVCNAEHIPSVTSTVVYGILGLSAQKVSLKGGGDGTEPVTSIYIGRFSGVNCVETEVRAQTSNIDLACYVQFIPVYRGRTHMPHTAYAHLSPLSRYDAYKCYNYLSLRKNVMTS